MKDIKLVIWDLDDTFWNGTLSEGGGTLNDLSLKMLDILTDRGIVNSIVSKNDYDNAMNHLKRLIPDKWEYFVFPSIDWTPKGLRVKELLANIGFLPDNVLMVDDNIHNLEEISFYNPGINCVTPDELENYLKLPQLKGKNDEKHTRLQQYKNLEVRYKEKKKYQSNAAFLKASSILITIDSNIKCNIDRIVELINRTNQLNYTNVRITKDELLELLNNSEYECACVWVSDKYGDYGICGFYAINNNKLVHFLFSCRVLGMGIQQYVYAKLGFPEVEINGNVAFELSKEDYPKWITEKYVVSQNKISGSNTKTNILLVGGCDLEQMSAYLENSKLSIDKELNTILDGREYRSSDSSQIINAIVLSDDKKKELCQKLPFYDERITFKTKMFDNQHNIIVYSVIDDYIRGMYVSKINKELMVGFAGYFDQKEWIHKYPSDEFKWLFDNFDYIGREPKDIFEKNLRKIIEKTKNKNMILINGTDIDVSDLIGIDRVERNIEMNSVVDRVVADYDHVSLLDVRKLVKSRDDVNGDNRHYMRRVYYEMSGKLMELINGIQASDSKVG